MPVSATAMVEAFKQHSTAVWLILVTIDHTDLESPIRLVNSRKAVTSNGSLFTPFGFDVVLPDSDGENLPRAQLRLDNISRELYQEIMAIRTAPTVAFQVCLAETPDSVEYETGIMRLERIVVDEIYLTADIVPLDISREPWPGATFSPSRFPGLF